MNVPRLTTISGTEFLWRAGTGPNCLVLLHGVGSNAHSFDPLFERLPADWSLVSWNAPGYGTSVPLPSAQPTAAAYAERLQDLADSLSLDRFAIAGHSLGTLIATEFARRHPQRVTALVLISCAMGYRIPAGAPLPEKAAARLRDLERLGPRAFAEARAPNLLHDPDPRTDLLGDAIEAMAAINPDGYAQAVHMLASGNLAAAAAGVQAPALVLVGAEDRVTPPDQSRRTYGALRLAGAEAGTEYREIEGAGHLVHREKPDAVAAEIIRFLAKVNRTVREAST